MQKGKQSYRHVCQKITSRTFSLSLTHTHTHTTVLYTRAITKQRSERTTTCLSNENVHNSKRKGTSCRTKRNEAYRTEVGGVTGRRRRGKRRIHYLLQHSVCTTLSDQNALPACFFYWTTVYSNLQLTACVCVRRSFTTRSSKTCSDTHTTQTRKMKLAQEMRGEKKKKKKETHTRVARKTPSAWKQTSLLRVYLTLPK